LQLITEARIGEVVDIKQNLESEAVDRALPVPPLCVEPTTTVREVLTLLKQHDSGSCLICREGVLVGIFTERDALRLMASSGDLDAKIESVMVPNPTAVPADVTVAEAIQTMFQGGYRRLPAIDAEGHPVKMVKTSGIVHYLVEHFPSTVYNLPPVTQPMTQEREGS